MVVLVLKVQVINFFMHLLHFRDNFFLMKIGIVIPQLTKPIRDLI